jgi:hypothetical protein
MKSRRKNVDLPNNTISVLILEGSLRGFGSLKPFLEHIINDAAEKAMKARPDVYKNLLSAKKVR